MRLRGFRSGGYRRTRWAAAGGLVAIAASAALPMPRLGAQTAPSVEPGQGQAIAQAWKIDPKTGGLSFGFTFGQGLAGHQNNVSRAVSQAINTGVIGGTMAGPNCDGGPPTWPRDQQPQPLEVDSRDEGAAAGKNATDYGSPTFNKFARASDKPLAESVTTMQPFVIPGVLAIGGGVTRTTSGIVNGERQAIAMVDISEVNLATVVKFSDLHWEATYRSSGPGEGVVGKFTVGHAVINGMATPASDPSLLAKANDALKLFGLKLVEPKAYQTGGVLFIDPMAIAVVPNSSRDEIAKQIVDNTDDGRKQLFGEILKHECDFADVISVFDIVTGSMTGAGEFSVLLGGAQASSAVIPKTGFSLDGVTLESFLEGFEPGGGTFPVPEAVSNATTSYTGVAAPSATGIGATRRVVTSPGGSRQAINAKPASANFKGKRGGAMAGVGLATLFLLALVAEGDRRKMRRAQREIPVTEE